MPCKIIVEVVEIAFLGNERSKDFNVVDTCVSHRKQ